MAITNWLKGFKLDIHTPGTGFALMVLALTQVPVAIKTSAEIYCMEKVGVRTGSFIAAVKECN
ncbi:hypothetical protein [Prochlorococcus sp. MIT 1307]|uniref:hypothetical protein n=1 Tax=Prochlorococcus sp. MIT 1307 TaxID=3096219 RepID=UPI002A76522A|nr:hypothetical protein [Prochlorococcus sp. MIT 1307]